MSLTHCIILLVTVTLTVKGHHYRPYYNGYGGAGGYGYNSPYSNGGLYSPYSNGGLYSPYSNGGLYSPYSYGGSIPPYNNYNYGYGSNGYYPTRYNTYQGYNNYNGYGLGYRNVQKSYPTPVPQYPDLSQTYEPARFINNSRTEITDWTNKGMADIASIMDQMGGNTQNAYTAMEQDLAPTRNILGEHQFAIDNAKNVQKKNPLLLDQCLNRAKTELDARANTIRNEATQCIQNTDKDAMTTGEAARYKLYQEGTTRQQSADTQSAQLQQCATAKNTGCTDDQIKAINNNVAGMVTDRNTRVDDARAAESQQVIELEGCNRDRDGKIAQLQAKSSEYVNQCIAFPVVPVTTPPTR